MKIVSYNINGIRASSKRGILYWIKDFDADIYCIQEVRASQNVTEEILFNKGQQIDLFSEVNDDALNYNVIYNCGQRAGYSGTMILSKTKPDKVFYDMGEIWLDNEGRTTTVIFNNIAIVNSYVPNGNSRLDFKMSYLDALKKYIEILKKDYSVICVGDYNIAHNEIDLTNPIECRNKSVFLPIERKAFGEILNLKMIDTFRYLHPKKVKYSWRNYDSYINLGGIYSYKYRMDYILITEDLIEKLKTADILDVPYSDHLPVYVELL